jgi:hypothetical protein
MTHATDRYRGRAIGVALLLALGACDFIKPTTADPNAVGNASLDQLFTGVQVRTFYLSESIYARVASMWTQQTAGATSQFTRLDQYEITEDDTDEEFADHYIGGGLIDIRRATALASANGRRVYAGMLKVYEGWMIGTAADIYGDVPYSEAVDPANPQPKLDPQLEVYAAVQAKLDEAVADLGSGTGLSAGGVDLNFGGAAACWVQVAHSLKARYYLHVAEVQGAAAYQAALRQAQQGISSNACDWRAIHNSPATENNIWYQFQRDRPQHIVAGYYLTNLLNGGTPADVTDDDPRLALYFKPATDVTATGEYLGSRPGSPAGDIDEGASALNTDANGVTGPTFRQPILSCAENQFIIAEAQYRLGDPAAARAAGNAGLACEAARLGVSLPGISSALSGQALLEKLLEQKYVANFLNVDSWADYERTCYPRIDTFEGKQLPGRLYYGTSERQTNPHVPDVSAQRQKPRNANDPNPC